MSRFFVEKENITNKEILITDAADVKHISRVLRHRIGDIIEVSDGEIFEYDAKITAFEPDLVRTEILSKRGFTREPFVRVTLYQGIPKQAKMETIVQKTVEVGIASIVPVFSERTVVVDKGGFGKKVERWQRIADEAVKQCRRGVIPTVEEPVKFDRVPELMGENDINLFCFEDEEGTTIKDVLRKAGPAAEAAREEGRPYRIGLIVGPEGGFSKEESDYITGAGAVSVSLGRTILRAETAPIAGLAMIMYELEL